MLVIYFCFALFVGLLAWAAVSDIRTGNISNWACAGVALLGVGLVIARVLPFYLFLMGGVILFFSLFAVALFSPAEGIGGGDIKLIAAAGCCVGLFASIIGIVIMGVLAGAVMLIRRQKSIRLAPYIAVGFIPAFVFQYIIV